MAEGDRVIRICPMILYYSSLPHSIFLTHKYFFRALFHLHGLITL